MVFFMKPVSKLDRMNWPVSPTVSVCTDTGLTVKARDHHAGELRVAASEPFDVGEHAGKRMQETTDFDLPSSVTSTKDIETDFEQRFNLESFFHSTTLVNLM